MNRSILIVICDFLLVSLLLFSSPDPDLSKNLNNEGAAPQAKLEPTIATNQADGGKDLAAVMKLALAEEQKNRELLLGELNRARQSVSEREKQVQNSSQALQTREQEAKRLQQEQAALQARYMSAQTNLEKLNQQLQSTSTEALLSKEKLAEMEAELKKRAEQAAALQQQMAQLSRSNQTVLAEKQQLAGQLKVAETEKRYASEHAARMEQEVKVEREEKAKLAEGVKALASKSSELAQEVRENRPMTPNTVFNEFVTNRVQARFTAYRSGLLGIDSTKRRETETILVSDGTNTFALCHVQDTPLTFWNPGTDWDQLTGTLSRDATALPMRMLSFYWHDPRIVLVPLSKPEARQLGSKIYRVSGDPYKFQDAVLVGARDGYYGECRFQIDLSTPEYVKLDNSFIKGLFGKFNPSRGDLVFSKGGELLGVMANSTYCTIIRSFDGGASFQLGSDVRSQHTGETLSRLYTVVTELPLKLQ